MSETSPDVPPAPARDRLLDAAIEIAGRSGLEAVSYRSVAARAGVAHGLVRHYFGSKEGLLSEAFQRAAAQDATNVVLEADTLATFAQSFVASMNASWERPVMQFDEAIQAIRGVLPIENVVRQYDEYLAVVSRTLDSLGIADHDQRLSGLLFAALDGLTLQHMIYRDDKRTEEMLSLLRELLGRLAAADER
jgi:AcrR family transcriptional regulator